MIRTTLCYIEHDGYYLMLLRNKKAKDPNEGKWIGIGGKFEEGETPDECMLREVREETGIEPERYHFHGIIEFCPDNWEHEAMYLYTAVFPSKEKRTSSDTGRCESSTDSGSDDAAKADKSAAVDSFDSMPPLPECSEGTLRWMPKAEIMSLNLWEGDRIFLKDLLEGKSDINMRLVYHGDELAEAVYR